MSAAERFHRAAWSGALARWLAPAVITSSAVFAACDANVTSVGAWLPEASTGFYLEAEGGELAGGFAIGNDPGASGGRCIEPPAGAASLDEPGPARARYSITICTAGTYVLWGRVHSPDVRRNTFWIKFDGGSWYPWRITTGDVWHWNAFHDDVDYGNPLTFQVEAGAHELLVANAVAGNRLDRLYVTADGDTPPGNDPRCDPPHSVLFDGGCVPSCGSQGGNRCGVMACNGRPPLPAYDCDICCVAAAP